MSAQFEDKPEWGSLVSVTKDGQLQIKVLNALGGEVEVEMMIPASLLTFSGKPVQVTRVFAGTRRVGSVRKSEKFLHRLCQIHLSLLSFRISKFQTLRDKLHETSRGSCMRESTGVDCIRVCTGGCRLQRHS